MRRPALTLLLLALVTFFLGLGRQAITDSDEGFYAEAAREMVESGDWLTPHFNYQDRWQKPALYYWLAAGTYLVAGPTEFAARFWSALSGVGLVLLTWLAARRLGSEAQEPGLRTLGDDPAWLAGAIVATCFGCFAMARLALPDLPLAFLITLTIWALIENRWLLAGAAAGLGFVMKGPLAIVIPAIVILPIWWRERRFRTIRPRDVALAAVIFAAIGLPWYAAMTFEHGVAYLESFFVGDNLERFATDRFNEPRPVWFYIPIVIGGMLPWSMFLVVLPLRSVRDVLSGRRGPTEMEWRLLLWALMPLLFFTISIGKQPRYILPALPPLAILLAYSIAGRVRDAGASQKALAFATWATTGLYVTLAVLLVRAAPLFLFATPATTYAGILVLGSCAAVLGWLAATRRWRLLPLTMTVCATALLLSWQFGALTGALREPVEQMAALVRMHRQAGQSIGVYRVMVRNLTFYTGFEQIDLPNEEAVLDFLDSSHQVLLVVRAADLPRLEAISGITTTRLGEVQYLNTASVRLRTILAPIPAQDLEHVLLVTNK